MSITLQQLEFFFVIVVRMTGFIYTAPFFGLRNVPFRVKTGLALAMGIVMFYVLPYEPLVYSGVIGFATLVVKETLCGLIRKIDKSVTVMQVENEETLRAAVQALRG